LVNTVVEPKRVRAPEVSLTRALIALFTLAVAVGLYYVVGGPIPYLIHFGGPTGVAFEGRYAVTSEGTDPNVLQGGETLTSTYPHTLTVWGSRRQSVVVASQSSAEENTLNTITVRRVGVVCNEVYRWGTDADVVCE